MVKALLIILIILTSAQCHAEVFDCAAGLFKQWKLGQLKNFKLGEEVTKVAILQEGLESLAKEAESLAKFAESLTKDEAPPPRWEQDFIEQSLAFLEATPTKFYTCLFSKAGAKGKIYKFTESEKYEMRVGYIVLIKGVKVAYHYKSITNF